MKTFTALLLLVATVRAAEPVTYHLEHINLPVENSHQLMRSAITGNADAWEIMEPWIDDGTATVFSGAMICTMDTVPARVASAVEWIYPTEFDPPELPNVIDLDGVVTRKRLPMTPTTPTAYETRDVGIYLEIGKTEFEVDPFNLESPSLRESKVNLASELTEHLGNHVIGEREAREWLADFHHQRIHQFVNIKPGQWTLLGTSATPDPKIVTTTWLRQIPPSALFVAPASEQHLNNISYIAEWFTIDADHAPDWLDAVGADPDNTASYGSLKALVAEGHASTVSTRLFLSSSGNPVKNHAGDEMIYPTEAYPPELPAKVSGNVINGADLATEAMPAAFDMRHLGPEVQVETIVYEGSDLMHCNIYASLVDHDFDQASGIGKSLIHMPMFLHTEIKTQTYLQNGKPRLIGAMTTPVRTHPKPDVRQSEHPDDPPKYQIGNTPRTVFFLTATIVQP